jgi:hypothetical protein
MTTPQIDFTKPLSATLTNGDVQSIRLDTRNPSHAVVAGQLAAIAAAQACVPVYADLKKLEALSEQNLIAKNALMKSGIVVGL